MYQVTQGSTYNLPDVARFLDLLNQLPNHSDPAVRSLFTPEGALVVTRAPGRLDLMGGIADYSGSLVLQMPIQEATLVALQRTAEPVLQIVSLGDERTTAEGEHDVVHSAFSMSLNELIDETQPVGYAVAQAHFKRNPATAWAAYAAGAFLVLMRERGAHFPGGARILIHSDVPEGKGVSSSAAIEVAVMSAIAAAYDIAISARELAILCQKVENLVVGAPCGIMDQMSSACGAAHQLLALLCQPAEIQGLVTIPPELAVWGIDSGLRHAVSGADYGSVRVGAFMGYRILQSVAGHNWDGYLANLTPSQFEQEYAHHLPLQLQGSAFLAQCGNTTDTVTTVDPNRSYAVLKPTAHPIYEHFRVRTFANLLQGDILANAPQLGELMYQSHASYSACGLGSDGTDTLVKLARQTGAQQGIYGAKITGGGSGGTVAILGRHDAEAAVERIAAEYATATGHQPIIFRGSSLGAAAFGALHVQTNATGEG
ncbi:MAG: galactokinase family protein [Caldilineaceae bacterium]